jgi:hypothetical protein
VTTLKLAVAVVLLAGCSRLRVVQAIPTRDWTRPVTDAALESVMTEADGFVVGTVERAKKDPLYDDCGGIAEFFGKCDGTFTYRLTIRNDGDPLYLYANVPAGDTLVLPVGTRAVFVWGDTWLKQLGVCWERLRRGIGEHCESDQRAVIRSLDYVFPPSDSARVAWAFRGRS